MSFLDLRTKLRQDSILDTVVHVAEGGHSSAPLVVELDPTSFCDLACPECISSGLLNAGRFTEEALIQFADDAVQAGVRAVILIGGGEPLLHPATGRVIATLSAGGVAVGITTNGTQLHRYHQLVAQQVAWTRVSVDAATAQTYGRFRPARGGRNKFDQVIENMRALARDKSGRLGFSFLAMVRHETSVKQAETNIGEICDAVELADRVGCDYIEIKAEYDLSHFVKGHRSSALPMLEKELNRIERARPHLDIEVILQQNLQRMVDGDGPQVQPKDYSRCPVAELRTLITSSGAYHCPYHRGNPRARYGDPTVHSLTEMWASADREAVARRIRPDRDCEFSCIRHQSNLDILELADPRSLLRRNRVPDYDPFI
ncbi:radical SAM protein [Actinomycetospora lemnae]|uniref:Radical SAM protein n=1 Tax=Actinomycetospora lemnae TaxID=3019891 RepID=A0ABT5SZY1_9PSEU|nr:radical SAM protein [Actinomycetospora sp. DW7H6]MDD7968430.1 radical SAM protein [Actinomycetospora sp. DW7H6]